MLPAVLFAIFFAPPLFAGQQWSHARLDRFFDGSVPAPKPAEGVYADTSLPAKKPLQTTPPEKKEGSQAPPSPITSKPPLIGIENSDWQEVGTIEDALSESNPSAVEKVKFWDRLRNDGFWSNAIDKLCKEAQIPVKYKIKGGDYAHIEPRFKRFLRTGLDRRMILIDQIGLNLRLSHGRHLGTITNHAGVSAWGSASLEGISRVVRPLEGKRACKEIDTVLDLRTVKSVLPLDADRFSAMIDDEIWMIPLHLTASFSAGVSGSPAGVPISISWGYSRRGGASVTIRRIDLKTLRVRIHIDHARIFGPSVSATYYLLDSALNDLFQDQEFGGVTSKGVDLVESEITRQARKYLTARLTWFAQWFQQDHAMIEFILDPTDPSQMKALEKLLASGDIDVLDTLIAMTKTAASAAVNADSLTGRITELRQAYERSLQAIGKKAPIFTGTQQVDGFQTGLHLKIPILLDIYNSRGKTEETITYFDDAGGEFKVFRAHKQSETSMFEIPILGKLVKYSKRRSVMAFTYKDDAGKTDAPSLVYVHQEGYTMQEEGSARRFSREVAKLMELAGARLPVEKVFPLIAAKAVEPDTFIIGTHSEEADSPTTTYETFYRRGMAAFTLVLGQKALADVLKAKPEAVIHAYVRANEDSWHAEGMQLAIKTGSINQDGKVLYDSAVLGELVSEGEITELHDLQESVRISFHYGEMLAWSLRDIKMMDPSAQAKAFRDLVTGSIGYGIKYDSLMKVLVQLSEPDHLTAEFIVSAKPSDKSHPQVEGRYLFNRGPEEGESVQALAKMSSRFSRASEFTD